MTAALILVVYALAVAVLAPPLLARHWPSDRVSRLTVTLLQILTCSSGNVVITTGALERLSTKQLNEGGHHLDLRRPPL